METTRDRDRVAVIATIGFIAVIALFLAIFALGRALSSTGGSGGGASIDATPVRVELSEFAISPADLSVPAGSTLTVANVGSAPHNFTVEGTDVRTRDLESGESAALDLTGLATGTYTVLCDIPGHAGAGMQTSMSVTEAGDPTGDPAPGAPVNWEAVRDTMHHSISAFPAESEGIGGQLLEPIVHPDGVKEFQLVVEEIRWELEPGRVVDAIAYNGQIPGPTIKVDVGDRVRMTVENRLPEITSLHPHGVRLHTFEVDGVGYISQDPIEPGGTWSEEFVVDELSVGMYHGHDLGVHQVINGLAGAFLVGELPLPAGAAPVRETVMMLNDAGNIGFSLNGKSFPATEPYVLGQGETMLVHYMNEGLGAHPMHLHNNRQLVVAKDGFPLDSPYYVDTLNVAPGERYSVLVTAEQPGVWVWHCHILTHVEKTDGTMFGMLTALIVE